MNRIKDFYYAIGDFVRDRKLISGLVGAAVVLVVVFLVVMPGSKSSSGVNSVSPANAVQTPQCTASITNLKGFVATHPAITGPLSPIATENYNELTQNVLHHCPATTLKQVVQQVIVPWQRSLPHPPTQAHQPTPST